MIEHYKNDKSTVFSIVPYLVKEFKPGLYPGNFEIPPCYNDKIPNRLVIGASEHLMAIADQPRPARLVTPSFVIAQSIVTDFLDGQLWTTPEEHPGIAYIQGDISLAMFTTTHKEVFDRMRAAQRAWYIRVCKQTDNEWKRFQNTRVVSDQARFAAKTLGLEPEWLNVETVGFTFQKCPACGASNPQDNAVCASCRCILNEEKFKTLKFAN